MDYDISLRIITDRPLSEEQIALVRSQIAHEIMSRLGDGVLASSNDREDDEVRLLAVYGGEVHEIYSDGTKVLVDMPSEIPAESHSPHP